MQLEHSLHFMKGDIFNLTAELLINPVNTVGVMGAGLAEKFKKKFPKNFKEYVTYCKTVSSFKDYRYHVYSERKDFDWLPLAAVKAWDKNPRRNAKAVEPVARSIVRFGFVAPVVYWPGGGLIS